MKGNADLGENMVADPPVSKTWTLCAQPDRVGRVLGAQRLQRAATSSTVRKSQVPAFAGLASEDLSGVSTVAPIVAPGLDDRPRCRLRGRTASI